MLKVRQTYHCCDDVICIQYTYDSDGKVVLMKEIDKDSPLDTGEILLRRVEVTSNFFTKLLHNKNLA